MKFNKSRFHIDYGPSSLFARVLFKMKGVEKLKMHSTHFNMRLEDRNINENVMEQLKKFDINKWRLVTVEVRDDKGKFINSTWERIIDGTRYWITIGFNNTIQTIVIKSSYGKDKCVTSGELYNYVARVNKELMESERI